MDGALVLVFGDLADLAGAGWFREGRFWGPFDGHIFDPSQFTLDQLEPPRPSDE